MPKAAKTLENIMHIVLYLLMLTPDNFTNVSFSGIAAAPIPILVLEQIHYNR